MFLVAALFFRHKLLNFLRDIVTQVRPNLWILITKTDRYNIGRVGLQIVMLITTFMMYVEIAQVRDLEHTLRMIMFASQLSDREVFL